MGFSLRFPFTVFTPAPDFAVHSWGWGDFTAGVNPKPNPLNPGGVLVPGPGFELGKARLVLESGTSYPATSTLRSGALPGGVWGSLEVDAGQT